MYTLTNDSLIQSSLSIVVLLVVVVVAAAVLGLSVLDGSTIEVVLVLVIVGGVVELVAVFPTTSTSTSTLISFDAKV